MASFSGLKATGKVAARPSQQLVATTAAGTVPRAARSSAVIQCRKVAVLGAAGGIGQPLSLLLKMNRLVTDLRLYDIANVAGVAADLSHTNTPTKVMMIALLASSSRPSGL